jgi:FkbH-like protein
MAAFAGSESAVTLSFRLVDKFGDNGLIGVLIALPDPENATILRIDTWLMSCRVLGRQVEAETINQLCRIAKNRGFTSISGDYIPTPKNALVRDIYARMGFTHIAGDAGNATQWSLTVGDFQPTETAIAVDAQFDLQSAE